jgi:hypothetical protein
MQAMQSDDTHIIIVLSNTILDDLLYKFIKLILLREQMFWKSKNLFHFQISQRRYDTSENFKFYKTVTKNKKHETFHFAFPYFLYWIFKLKNLKF